jgi:DNA-binding NtrC family response regulator
MLRKPSQPGDDPSAPPIAGLIGSGTAMQAVYAMTRRVAASNASVLLVGETGTGKELIAKAIHELSPRSTGPFVRVNCGALSESLLESELFGHVRGSFTGAVANRAGRFEAAHTGTIFLDEINSTTPKLQVKLLRVLQEREFERVGDTETISVDTRVIAASNRELLDEVAKETFREDLYYRLNVVPIYLPPLRSRREDIPQLVTHFLEHYNEQSDRFVTHIGKEAMDALCAYHWPGNVRELQNVVERCVVLAEGDEITLDLLPPTMRGGRPPVSLPGRGGDLDSLARDLVEQGMATAGPDDDNLFDRVVNRVERELIAQMLAACSGVQLKAAARLGINRNTLRKKLLDHGLEDVGDLETDSPVNGTSAVAMATAMPAGPVDPRGSNHDQRLRCSSAERNADTGSTSIPSSVRWARSPR